MDKIAKFLFEVGMLKRTPRSGLQFLGSGNESVAEHICRTVYIGFVLAQLTDDVDEGRLLKMCLFHDLVESRTGDLNYVNKKYVQSNEERAMKDISRPLFFGQEMAVLFAEFNEGKSQESRLANDADQLELLLLLRECQDLGNKYSADWIPLVIKRLQTEAGIKLAHVILKTDWSAWWFEDEDEAWWINGK
ncbi:MAG: HD domain-containing protein [Deltaproteobacteria bacterium]|nr:HD domain-containing protein [Candidatus Anaeroferrophillus wilburensis]MBN2889072.1 HD domain-containing protein [Deltaproteobacteria bacterium]